jgi:hypothetical protein
MVFVTALTLLKLTAMAQKKNIYIEKERERVRQREQV